MAEGALLDPRIRLFAPSEEGLKMWSPSSPGQFVYYDRYSNGDDYSDQRYIEHFRMILRAMHEKRKLRVRFHGHRGTRQSYICIPYKLEYSSKDDKFRLITGFGGKPRTINLSRMDSVHILEPWDENEYQRPNEREKPWSWICTTPAMPFERAMLHFTDLEKETERIDDKHYRITLNYRQGMKRRS